MWLLNLFSVRGKALAIYKRGLKKAQQQDNQGAIAAYTSLILMPNVPADLKAMALFNRALIHSVMKDYGKARADLDSVLEIPNAPADVKAATKEKRERLQKRAKA